uniref:Ribosomal protein S1 n=1 Tax=Alsidium seaforthii TaxID=2007182 RepID=A0A1Z1MDX2_9FLOR|nr:ribosomal protein S1 [Bryothamnion seaforthii]ARW64035.1 ribosomal protein S1 [Bryothamnion seaforthii]
MNKFAKILKRYKYNLNTGDIVAGTILHEEHSGFLVNIGTQTAGYLPKEELEIASKSIFNNNLSLINATREFFLLTTHIDNKQCILSIKRLEYMRAWKRIKQIYLEDVLFTLNIKYVNKGGCITYLEGIQGFIPRSHINLTRRKEIKKTLIYNKTIECKLLTASEQKNQLILSNISALLNLCIHKFKLGELVYGQIILIKSYGLFIDVYGIKALLHISEIGSKYIKNIDFFFYIGKMIKVKIIYINSKHGKISVSRRNLK